MALYQSSCLVFSSSSSSKINAAIHVPNLRKIGLSIPKLPIAKNFTDELSLVNQFTTFPTQEAKININTPTKTIDDESSSSSNSATAELYMILEAVSDRIEMHKNIGEQRNNWNTLLLNSINMITLTAATMAGIAATSSGTLVTSLLALKLSSAILFSSATGLLAIMNKIQPSQLVEEQRNSARLFTKLQSEIKIVLALRRPTQRDVKTMMDRVLALDKAYPLPLLGAMLEKFPKTLEPSCWWPKKDHHIKIQETRISKNKNGWSDDLEMEMKEVLKVIKNKDKEDYVRLGNLALKVNKILAISGPILTSIATIASPFVGSTSNIGSFAAIVCLSSSALATLVNTFEHGGQVGMVFEMYRNCAGFFRLLEESIETTLEEADLEKRENGDVFEMKVALKLGRSLSQLREFAKKSEDCCKDGRVIDEFASKLM